MKNFKKIASAIAALSLAACVAVPMSATISASAVEIQVSSPTNDTGVHTYEAYQIFSGKVETIKGTIGDGSDDEKVLTGIEWAFVDEAETASFLDEVKALLGFSDTTFTADEASKKLTNTNADAFAAIVGNHTSLFKKTSVDAEGKLNVSLAGYYLVQDASSPTTGSMNSGAKTRYILEIVDTDSETPLKITAKAAAPSVDKLVLDETDDAETGAKAATETGLTGSWGETADHAIGETFQFKLTAQLPTSDEINKYTSYKLVFQDDIGTGVDFNTPLNMKLYLGDDTESVEIKSKADAGESKFYYEVNEKHLTVTIEDVKQLEKFSGKELSGLKVSVVYDAHLNESADVSKTSGSVTNNKNTVKLEYSNNPNVSGSGDWKDDHGETPDDTVWVFTYELDNTKYKDEAKLGNELEGAVFNLYAGEDTSGDPLKFKFVAGKGYILDNSSTASADVKSAASTGQFNFYGLDAGTYTLVEKEAPKGYNKLDKNIKLVITAEHSETAGTSNNVNLTYQKDTESAVTGEEFTDKIINQKGATLPSTGGIGTTLFYLGGGALVAVAGVMLITKKRMTKE